MLGLFGFFKNNYTELKQRVEAEAKAEAKKIEIEKGLSEYSSVISDRNVGDGFITATNSLVTVKRRMLGSKEKFGLLVYGSKCYFSMNFINSAKNYIQSGLPVCFLLDRTIQKNNEIYQAIKKINRFDNVTIYYFSRSVTLTDRILVGINSLCSEYVSIFSLNDVINPRSYLVFIDKILENEIKKCYIVLNDDDEYNYKHFFNASIYSVKGIIFNSFFLEHSIQTLPQGSLDFWFGHYLLLNLRNEDICVRNSPFDVYWRLFDPEDISIPDISYLIKDTLSFVDYLQSIDKLNDHLYTIYKYFSYILLHKHITETKMGIIASGVSIFLLKIKKIISKEVFDKYLYLFASIFNFDQILKSANIHYIHSIILNKSVDVRNNCIAVIETDFMNDLKESFVPILEKSGYDVIYISKPQYYDYHFLNCLVMRAEIQPAQYVIASNDVHNYITNGKQVLTLWHGLGMLKKITESDRVKYPMNYIVTSSISCVKPWSDTFQLPESNVLPFGNIQTDILYNSDYNTKIRNAIRIEYKIPESSKIIFFAPTFRNGKLKYYDFGIDIEEFSEYLMKNNLYLITKRHHVFSHILKDKGLDTSGVRNSLNGRFIVDENHNFVELLCTCDCFVTDYSSGLFYALVKFLPVVLYAPDVDEYKFGPNGFMIDYPKDLPFPFVGKPSIESFIRAIDKSWVVPKSENYKKFRDFHVGSCDGCVSQRIIDFIRTWDGQNFDTHVAEEIVETMTIRSRSYLNIQ